MFLFIRVTDLLALQFYWQATKPYNFWGDFEKLFLQALQEHN